MTESQDTLDLDDVAAGHPVAVKDLAELRERVADLEQQLDDEEKSHAEKTVILSSTVRYLKRRDARVANMALGEIEQIIVNSRRKSTASAADIWDDGWNSALDLVHSEISRLRREAEGGDES
ncbi:MAG: hypothetical protein ACLFVU_02135 [Phycisphaerae bacterium]